MFDAFDENIEIDSIDSIEENNENECISAIVSNEYVRKFLLAGNCHCTIENMKTGNRFTYKIKRNKEKKNMYFVYVMSGLGEIYCGYFYVNATLIDYRKGAKGNVDENDVRIQALLYTLKNSKKLPSYVIVQHFGKCARCGSPISDLDSIRRGICSGCNMMI